MCGIALALNHELISAAASGPIDLPDAFDYILRERFAYNQGPTRKTFAKAISLFENALALHPSFT